MKNVDKASNLPMETESTLRFPTYQLAGVAGTSFKPEHLAAISAISGPQGFFEIHGQNCVAKA